MNPKVHPDKNAELLSTKAGATQIRYCWGLKGPRSLGFILYISSCFCVMCCCYCILLPIFFSLQSLPVAFPVLRFEVLTAVSMAKLFWIVTPC